MPRGNGTGPAGMGPMTGRGAGYCNGFAAPGYASAPGFGGGYGRCRGRGRMYNATGMPGWARGGRFANADNSGVAYDEKAFLKTQAEFLEKQLDAVKNRLDDLNDQAE